MAEGELDVDAPIVENSQQLSASGASLSAVPCHLDPLLIVVNLLRSTMPRRLSTLDQKEARR